SCFEVQTIAGRGEADHKPSLADAVNRLLGLDIIHRRKADLGVYLRDQKRDKLPSDIRKEMESLEATYQTQYAQYQSQLSDIETIKIELTEPEATKERLTQTINELGGAWASNKQEAENKEQALRVKRNELQTQIRNLIADAAPLALAKAQLEQLLKQLSAEQLSKRQLVVQIELRKQLNKVQQALIKSLGKEHQKAIEASIADSMPASNSADTEIIHDISDSEFNRLNHLITKVVPEQQARVQSLSTELDSVEEELAT